MLYKVGAYAIVEIPGLPNERIEAMMDIRAVSRNHALDKALKKIEEKAIRYGRVNETSATINDKIA